MHALLILDPDRRAQRAALGVRVAGGEVPRTGRGQHGLGAALHGVQVDGGRSDERTERSREKVRKLGR